MKKSLLIVSLFCFSLGLMAQEAKSSEVKGAHPYKVEENEEIVQEFSHWSLTPHFGFNYFDGDFNTEMKHAIYFPNAALDIEYAFTPVWGLGLNYTFSRYGVTGMPGADNADMLLRGYMHRAGLYVSMDFMNLFFPRAKKKIFSANAIVGGGYAWYMSTTYYPDDDAYGRGHTASQTPMSMDKYNGQLFLQAGLGIEFNLNRTLALGFRATYDYFVNDYIDGRGVSGAHAVASKNNDGMVDVSMFMRFKLVGVKKTHVRNISSLDTWAKKQDVQPCHDTVIIRHDSIIVRETYEHTELEKEQETIYYVYFDNNKSNLDNKALITIQQVADRLEEDTTLYAVVTGYCDNTGSDKLNFALGDKRADNVIDELKAEHGIDPERMHAQGLGKLIGRRSQAAYGPNRRAAIRLVDKETFERMKANLDEQRALRPEEPEAAAPQEKTIPLSESARKEKVNQYKQRESEHVVTDESTTLSRLARKYYNNTYCWVYIYIANKDKITNPNKLTPGITLTIPELTQQEMNITKDEGLTLYNNARLGK